MLTVRILRFYEILQKFQHHFSACVKFHVENEWEISRMSSDGWRFFLQDFIKPQYSRFQVGCPKIATRIHACAKFPIQNSRPTGYRDFSVGCPTGSRMRVIFNSKFPPKVHACANSRRFFNLKIPVELLGSVP